MLNNVLKSKYYVFTLLDDISGNTISIFIIRGVFNICCEKNKPKNYLFCSFIKPKSGYINRCIFVDMPELYGLFYIS